MRLTRHLRILFAILQCGVFVIAAFSEAKAQKTDGRVLTHPEIKGLPAKAKRWALIIGVDRYEEENITPLSGATNDANELARALKEHAGFDENQIIVLTNEQKASKQPTRRNILRYLSNLKGLVPHDGLVLISFSGHGIERNGRAFLMPYDASYTDDVRLLEETAISAEVIKRDIKESGVLQVLILLDACRNDPTSSKADSVNPLSEAYRRGFEFDVRNREITAFATLYATSIGARAYEDSERKGGYFTLAVVEGLRGKAADQRTGEVTLESLVRYLETSVPVRVATNLGNRKVQKPFAVIEGYKASELVLAIGTAVEAPKFDRVSGELALWREVEKSDTQETYEAFLKAYPSGEYSAVATYKLQAAKQKSARVAEYYERGVKLLWDNAEEALANFTKAIELNPNHARAYRERGRTYANRTLGRTKPEAFDAAYNSALADYNKAIDLDPNDSNAFNLRGILFDTKKDHQRAISDYTRAIELDPKSSPPLSNRAGTYLTIGRNDLAIKDYSRCLEIELSSIFQLSAYKGRARAYLANKNYDLALMDFTTTITLEPGEAANYNSRGDYYTETRDYGRAIVDYTNAIDVLSKKSYGDNRWYMHLYHRNRGDAYFATGNNLHAIEDYTKAIEFWQWDAKVYRKRATAYEAVGDKNKANADIKSAESWERSRTN